MTGIFNHFVSLNSFLILEGRWSGVLSFFLFFFFLFLVNMKTFIFKNVIDFKVGGIQLSTAKI